MRHVGRQHSGSGLQIEARMQDSSRGSSPGPATDEDSDVDYRDDLAADDCRGYTRGLQLRFAF